MTTQSTAELGKVVASRAQLENDLVFLMERVEHLVLMLRRIDLDNFVAMRAAVESSVSTPRPSLGASATCTIISATAHPNCKKFSGGMPMRTETPRNDSASAFNGPAPVYQSMVMLMQQNLDLSRDLMHRSLETMQRLSGLPSETLGRIEPFRGPASAWSDLNQRSIELVQKFADQRMDTLQQWTRIGLELFERAMPPSAQQAEAPPPPPNIRMAEKPRRAA